MTEETKTGPIDYYNLWATIPYSRSKEKTSEDLAYQPFLTFEDRESYLDWRDEWRDGYETLSDRIRTNRKAWRAEGSEHEIKRHVQLFRDRAFARAMLELRKASKRKAGELRRAAKEARSAVA